jgi:hypothetical protein
VPVEKAGNAGLALARKEFQEGREVFRADDFAG